MKIVLKEKTIEEKVQELLDEHKLNLNTLTYSDKGIEIDVKEDLSESTIQKILEKLEKKELKVVK